MTWEHERVEELLAAHALGGLDPDDSALAERALVEHVPGCERCRRAYDAFRLAAGDLALGADPVEPPAALRARLRRTLGPRRRRALLPGWAAAAAVVALAGLWGWNVTLTDRLEEAEIRQGWMVDALAALGHPRGSVVSLEGAAQGRVSVLYVEEEFGMYVVASHLPEPQGLYRVWLLSGSRAWSPGVLETDHGTGMMPVATDPARWETVLLTDEPDTRSRTPASSPVVSAPVDSD